MPKITQEKLSEEKLALIVEVTEKETTPYLQKAANTLSINKPAKGFRPGAIAIDAAKKVYGEMALYEASLDFIVRGTLTRAVEDSGIKFIGQPEISVLKCAPGNPVSYKAIFLLAPKVIIADHSKIGLERKKISIDDERVAKVLGDIQESRASEVKVDRASKMDDHVVVDVSMFLDSVPLDGGQMQKQHFILGKNELWEGFGKEVVGLVQGKKKEFTLTIPKTHMQKNIAGKNIEFAVTLHEVFERTLPTIDDAFAKSLGAFENLEALKKQLYDNLIIESENKEQERIENELLTKLVEQSSFSSIPTEMTEQEKDRVLAETKHMVSSRGMEWQGYLDHLKKTEDEIYDGFTQAADRRIKNNLVLISLSEKMNIDVTEEEIEKEFLAYAQYNPEAVKNSESVERIRLHIKVMITHRKALAKAVEEILKN
jgi:trigger factor